jgi:hypothetical protein
VRKPRRALTEVIWGLLQFVVIALLFFAGGVAGAYLTWDLLPHLAGTRSSAGGVLPGFAVGVAAALTINHNARMWLQRLRLRRLRARGVEAQAAVTRLRRSYLTSGRGPGTTTYTVFVRWLDPVTGDITDRERRYRFWGRGSRRFETVCAARSTVPVYYPRHRLERFILDVPFAPTMADFFE